MVPVAEKVPSSRLAAPRLTRYDIRVQHAFCAKGGRQRPVSGRGVLYPYPYPTTEGGVRTYSTLDRKRTERFFYDERARPGLDFSVFVNCGPGGGGSLGWLHGEGRGGGCGAVRGLVGHNIGTTVRPSLGERFGARWETGDGRVAAMKLGGGSTSSSQENQSLRSPHTVGKTSPPGHSASLPTDASQHDNTRQRPRLPRSCDSVRSKSFPGRRGTVRCLDTDGRERCAHGTERDTRACVASGLLLEGGTGWDSGGEAVRFGGVVFGCTGVKKLAGRRAGHSLLVKFPVRGQCTDKHLPERGHGNLDRFVKIDLSIGRVDQLKRERSKKERMAYEPAIFKARYSYKRQRARLLAVTVHVRLRERSLARCRGDPTLQTRKRGHVQARFFDSARPTFKRHKHRGRFEAGQMSPAGENRAQRNHEAKFRLNKSAHPNVAGATRCRPSRPEAYTQLFASLQRGQRELLD
ncbi:hypothetical protein BJ875DRAFT_437205 [Amylocarpus encephaloides]|uniref:Uncharacterized protein n=1 Tax=Amylocarpus encephaloides TaxID=45428 RepID=A0A9P7YS04_9HELO|nr:hypothetical protein BJ875DRAFT_437205 [Amylocarpus encephaloides]